MIPEEHSIDLELYSYKIDELTVDRTRDIVFFVSHILHILVKNLVHYITQNAPQSQTVQLKTDFDVQKFPFKERTAFPN